MLLQTMQSVSCMCLGCVPEAGAAWWLGGVGGEVGGLAEKVTVEKRVQCGDCACLGMKT